jgi:hypothetical protein
MKSFKLKKKKMFNKIFIILTLIIIFIQSIFSLKSTDLCFSSLKCKGTYGYQCSKNLCGSKKETCDTYHIFKKSHPFSLHFVRKFQRKIISCNDETKFNPNDYCFKNSICYKQQAIWAIGFKTVIQKVNCKCEGKSHSFRCGDFCTLNNKKCDLLNMNINKNDNFNINNFQKC